MALRVWLPLNGNLNNQGLSNVTVINNGATVDNNGKIGKTYSFDGSDDYISVNYPQSFDNNWTYCCWIYNDDVGGRSILYGDFNLPNTGNISIEKTTGEKIRFYWNNGSPDVNFNNSALTASAWTHLALTYDGSIVSCYINGALTDTRSGALTSVTKTGVYYIGRDGRTGTTAFKGKMNDFRLYDECLSPKQIKEISKGLICHYKLDNPFNMDNLFINGYGELGSVNWKTPANISTTELPSGVAGVKESFTANETTTYFPVIRNHSYTFSLYIKSSGATSGNTYPSILPYDIDKKFIAHHQCKNGFWTVSTTTLTQPLNPGDTIIYAADLSKWDTGDNYGYHVAIFGYEDSTKYVYPDLEYTQDTPVFGTKTDKSHINKTNNTITLNAAYTGKARPAGTTICQTTEGSTYYYPFGAIALSGISNWTAKTATFTPQNDNRLRWGVYWRYFTYSNTYQAAIKLIDNNAMNTTITDVSGNGYNATLTGVTNSNTDSPRYTYGTYFANTSAYIKLPALTTAGFASSFSIVWWSKITDMNGRMAWGFGDGNRLNLYPSSSVFCCNTGDGASNQYKNNGTAVAYSGYNNGWHQYAMVGDGTSNKLYIDGEYKGSATTNKNITGTQIYISGWDTGTSYTWSGGSMSDFRIYSTALSADDILIMYKNSGIIDNKNNIYAYEFKEE